MELTELDLGLVETARNLITRLGDRHSVAAVVRTADGRAHPGVNIHHFSGGPCAEIVALGRASTDSGSSPPTSIVAVGNGTRGIVTPCGRCRQILHDLWPDILIIIEHGGRAVKVALPELLPEP